MGKRILLIANPQSSKTEQGLPAAVAGLQRQGFTVVPAVSGEVAELAAAIRHHCREVDLVVVAGGDGTLNAMLEPLLECGLPLGILPLGTANDLARTLEIPAEIEGACELIADGRRHRIDLGRVNSKLFFNVASLGLSVAVSHRLSPSLKKRLGILSYLYGMAESLRAYRPFRAEIVVDGRASRVRTIQISVGNGRYYGGGMAVAEDAAIDDHRLDVYTLKPLPFWKLVLLGPALYRGTHGRKRESVLFRHGREVRVLTSRSMEVDTDGEVTTRTPARFEVVPAALEVVVAASYLERSSSAREKQDVA